MTLITINPLIPKEPVAGPIPRPTFQIIMRESGEIIAEFHPNKYNKCQMDQYKPLFDEFVKIIEAAAQGGLEEFERFEANRKSFL